MTYPTQYFPGLKSVRLLTICNDPNHSRTATGFIILEDGIPYLYTCWHVFTGQKDISDVSTFPHSPPREIVVQTKQVEARDPGVSVVGGEARHRFPLYDRGRPRWLQQKAHRPHEVWNEREVHVPAFLDVVKLPINLPDEILVRVGLTAADVDDDMYPVVSEDLIIAGYPHGFSAMEGLRSEPEPLFLKRSVASRHTHPFGQIYLDGYGFPGMSGSPVYRAENWKLFGIYTGIMFPDKSDKVSDELKRLAAIGLVVPLLVPFSVFRINTDADGPFEEWNDPIQGGPAFLID
jgi:Trypsin-like peptidase domain